jgi:endonuclease-3
MRGNATPFEILISCLLSLRARDEVTDVVSKDLFEVADSPEKLVKLPMAKLKKIIFRSGHFNKKAVALKEVSKDFQGFD